MTKIVGNRPRSTYLTTGLPRHASRLPSKRRVAG